MQKLCQENRPDPNLYDEKFTPNLHALFEGEGIKIGLEDLLDKLEIHHK